MSSPQHRLTREFFRLYPDFALCRALALNILEQNATREEALHLLAEKARATEENRREIDEKLDGRTVLIGRRRVPIRQLSLREICRQEDHIVKEIAEFYFKHPYAHGRLKKSRLLPRWLRTIFLSTLLGNARRRGLDLDYAAFLELCSLL